MAQTTEGLRKWYVVRTRTGQEKKFIAYMEHELKRSPSLQEKVGQVLLPSETVVEVRGGKKRTRERAFFPSYVLIEAVLDNEVKHVVLNSSAVLGFLSTGNEPTPLRPEEVNRILGRVDEARQMGVVEVPFRLGEWVRITGGPFQDFEGTVEEINPEKMKVKVMVSIFGRKTPVEVDFSQVRAQEE